MRISAIQMRVDFEQMDKNFEKAERLIRLAALEKPDVVVLPEMWNTGFFPRTRLGELADKEGHHTKKLMSKLSKELNVNIVAGSIANEKDNEIYNTSYLFNRAGQCIGEYDKTHLFSYMKEDEFFQKGGKTAVVEIDGIKCGIIICYDVRFLELVRTLTLQGVEILFVVAQWPTQRIRHWEILNLARAIENQIYVACVNGCGTAGDTIYGGHSALIDPWGEKIAAADEAETIITADFDMEVVRQIRTTINVYRDRRTDLYRIV